MSDKKPWEEEWYTAEAEPRCFDVYDTSGAKVFESSRFPGTPESCLAAAAPDLVRALLAVEWVEVVASHGEEPGWECPQCSRFYSGKERPINKPHFGSCALDAALKKAGVR